MQNKRRKGLVSDGNCVILQAYHNKIVILGKLKRN